MAEFIKLDHSDIQTIIGALDEIGKERTAAEDLVYEKVTKIAALQKGAIDREKAELFIDPDTGRLTISRGKEISEPVPYKGIARLGPYFAVTDYYKDVFPTNVLLKFSHANPSDRAQFFKTLKNDDLALESNLNKNKF